MTGFVFLSVLTQNKARYQFILGEKPLLVPIFSSDFHFNPYILFLLFLVPILKNASYFSPCVTSEMEKTDVANGRNK